MKYTSKQKADIKVWWAASYGLFRFMADGSVLARPNKNYGWGILLTAQQSESHLRTRGLLK